MRYGATVVGGGRYNPVSRRCQASGAGAPVLPCAPGGVASQLHSASRNPRLQAKKGEDPLVHLAGTAAADVSAVTRRRRWRAAQASPEGRAAATARCPRTWPI